MEQRERVGNMLLGAVGACWQGAVGAAVDGPAAASEQGAPLRWPQPRLDSRLTTYINRGKTKEDGKKREIHKLEERRHIKRRLNV